ncbi:MAG: hypothetical protein IKK00_04775 [Oscillospiraceae bacterium]|nr:hypothetical protein [Oscillospiraceae bacterium]
MKRKGIIIALAVLLSVAITCQSVWLANRGIPRVSLNLALRAYEAAFDDGAPDDLKLTIYYISPAIVTRAPIYTLEQLRGANDDHATQIHVGAEELAAHAEQFRKLDADDLCPETVYSAASGRGGRILGFLRMVYILEREDGEILLKIYACNLVRDESVIVNGIKVKNDPVFYELIDPYLTDADRETLHWQHSWDKN